MHKICFIAFPVILLCNVTEVYAQYQHYFLAPDNYTTPSYYTLYKLSAQDCDTMPVRTINIPAVGTYYFGGITFHPNGRLYAMETASFTIYDIDTLNGNITSMQQMDGADAATFGRGALVAHDNGFIYAFGFGYLAAWNPQTNAFLYFPEYTGLSEAATYAGGKIYYVTLLEGVYEANLDDIANSELVFSHASLFEEYWIYGISTVYTACDSVDIYAHVAIGNINDGSTFRLNFETNTFELHCIPGFNIANISSPYEYFPPPGCHPILDLDADNSSGGAGYDFLQDTLCAVEPVLLADLDLTLTATHRIDSVVVFIENADGDFLSALATTGSIAVQGDGTARLRYLNTGAATPADFAAVLFGTAYINSNPDVQVVIKVAFVAWSGINCSDTARACIPLLNLTPSAGEDAVLHICENNPPASLFNALGGTPQPGGNWQPQLPGNLFDPAVLPSGEYLYIQTGHNLCPNDTTTVDITVHPAPAINLGSDTLLCSGESLALQAPGGALTYLWSTGAAVQTIGVNAPGGLIWVEATNGAGCSARDSIVVTFSSVSAMTDTIRLCPGETYSFEGAEIGRDTSICRTYLNSSGCDSTYCLLVVFAAPDWTYIGQSPSCLGGDDGSVTILTTPEGQYLYSLDGLNFGQAANFGGLAAGSFLVYLRDAQGCIFEQEVILMPGPLWQIDLGPDIEIPVGEAVNIEAQHTGASPIATINWQPPTYLDCSTCSSVLATPSEDVRYLVTAINEAGCSAQDSVRISVTRIEQYFFPLAFSPNGDGINDRFGIMAAPGALSVQYIRIFDRWGNLVYEQQNVTPGDQTRYWDGRYKGRVAPSEVYVFVAEILWSDGAVEIAKGDLTLLR